MFYRVIIALLLSAGLLSGCSVYNAVFHPHRLSTPPMTQAAKTRARAAEKARHKGTTLQPTGADGSQELADTGDGTPAAAGTPAADARSADDKNKAIENMLGHTYDKKTGLLKRNKLQRLQADRRALHHYDLSAPKHTDATRDARRLRKHPKSSKSKAEPKEEKEPRPAAEPAPAPDPTQPAPAKGAKQKQPKAPKPDPTQPANGN